MSIETSQRPTPETDAKISKTEQGFLIKIVPADFARRLEQQRDALLEAASIMVAVTHFSGCIDESTADARNNLEAILAETKPT